jgi:hypothetical protein
MPQRWQILRTKASNPEPPEISPKQDSKLRGGLALELVKCLVNPKYHVPAGTVQCLFEIAGLVVDLGLGPKLAQDGLIEKLLDMNFNECSNLEPMREIFLTRRSEDSVSLKGTDAHLLEGIEAKRLDFMRICLKQRLSIQENTAEALTERLLDAMESIVKRWEGSPSPARADTAEGNLDAILRDMSDIGGLIDDLKLVNNLLKEDKPAAVQSPANELVPVTTCILVQKVMSYQVKRLMAMIDAIRAMKVTASSYLTRFLQRRYVEFELGS